MTNVFNVINGGDPGINLACSNGGLFHPEGVGEPDIGPAARFLREIDWQKSHRFCDKELHLLLPAGGLSAGSPLLPNPQQPRQTKVRSGQGQRTVVIGCGAKNGLIVGMDGGPAVTGRRPLI